MFRILIPLGLCLPLLATSVHAAEIKGVVELFTSQGCASCPPADAVLSEMIDAGDVLALSYHVDYWNYLGWKDTLSEPANTARQYGYAETWGNNSVYTPQAVVNGRDHVNGADREAVHALVSTMADSGKGLRVDVGIRADKGKIAVEIGDGDGKADVVAVYFDELTRVDISGGENRGHTVAYRHSVRNMETIGMWEGKAITLNLPKSVLSAHPGRGCAILLQSKAGSGTPSAIIGAAILEPDNLPDKTDE